MAIGMMQKKKLWVGLSSSLLESSQEQWIQDRMCFNGLWYNTCILGCISYWHNC